MAKPPAKKSIVKEQIKEKTSREKALEFARNVPKPKVKIESSSVD
jgi:Jhy protein